MSVKRKPKTYLTYILGILEDYPLDWTCLIERLKDEWNEDKVLKEEYIIRALIKGIDQGHIEHIEVPEIKTKYKGHQYKLITDTS